MKLSLFIDRLTGHEVRAAAGGGRRSCRPVSLDVAEVLAVEHVIHRLVDDDWMRKDEKI